MHHASHILDTSETLHMQQKQQSYENNNNVHEEKVNIYCSAE